MHKTLYSLALRLLNRGVVLPEYQETEEALREKFNQNDLGAINWLFDSAKYSSPFFPYDSTREKEFAEYYFPRLIGDNWATFVFAQAGFDVLVPGSEKSFQGQRVDFFINKNGRKVVVELDGPEHEVTKESDRYRDHFLEDNGFIVRRYLNSDVDNRSEAIFEDLKEALGTPRNTRIDADVDNKYLVASKLCHQIAVAIVKCLDYRLDGHPPSRHIIFLFFIVFKESPGDQHPRVISLFYLFFPDLRFRFATLLQLVNRFLILIDSCLEPLRHRSAEASAVLDDAADLRQDIPQQHNRGQHRARQPISNDFAFISLRSAYNLL